MTKPHIAFAVPGEITTLTGGYIYDRRVMHELRDLGWTVDHIALPAGFPNPSPQQMRAALDLLQAIPADRPVIIAAADPICRHPTAAQRTRRFAAGLGADHRSGLALRNRGDRT